jgi:hypothetical protein
LPIPFFLTFISNFLIFSAKAEKVMSVGKARKDDMSMAKAEKEPADEADMSVGSKATDSAADDAMSVAAKAAKNAKSNSMPEVE